MASEPHTEKELDVAHRELQTSDYIASASHSEEVKRGSDNVIPTLATDRDQAPTATVDNNSRLRQLLRILKVAMFPVVSTAYIVFSLVVRYRIVYVDVTEENLAVAKAGLTTLAIIIISMGLIPLRNVVAELKSEEFFRSLEARAGGSSIKDVDSISLPSTGFIAMAVLLARRVGSKYLGWTLAASVALVAVSSLSPAALSIAFKEIEGDVVALRVGAIPAESIFDAGTLKFTDKAEKMATDQGRTAKLISWAETLLSGHVGLFEDHIEGRYLVPKLLDVPVDTSARYISDVIELNPSCRWIAPNIANVTALAPEWITYITYNSSFHGAIVEDVAIGHIDDLFNNIEHGVQFVLVNAQSNLYNTTSWYPPQDGSSLWILAVCRGSCDSPISGGNQTPVDLSGIPTTSFQPVYSLGGTQPPLLDISVLRCRPGAAVKTRETTIYRGTLTIGDVDLTPTQGNIKPGQGQMFLSNVASTFIRDTTVARYSVTESLKGLGDYLEGSLLIGRKAYNAIANNDTVEGSGIRVVPQSIEDITESYGSLVSSLSKAFLNGTTGNTFVPGRVSKRAAIFTSSLPHVITSAILMLALAIFGIVVHFRREAPQFTFVNIMRSVNGTDIPAAVEDMDKEALRRTIIRLQRRDDSPAKRRLTLDGAMLDSYT